MLSLDRRAFLAAVPLASSAWLPHVHAQEPPRNAGGYPGLIVRQQEPLNLEFPFASLDALTVPTERFFVRNHFPIPQIEVASWSLEIAGAVERPLRLTFQELMRLPSRTALATLECAGNNRVNLVPRVEGVPWGSGAVGTAEWTGVPLAALLDRAGVRDGAVDVVLEGADEGTISEPRSPGTIHFARSLPLAKARRPESILAYRMNGRELTPSHGAPVRAIVPGWYGMASVKWLTRILVLDRAFDGFFQTMHYTRWERVSGLPSLRPITDMEVKSSIARPAPYETVPAGRPFRIHGAAWAGEADVTRVDISTDGGAHWTAATLLGDRIPHTWRLWEFAWTPRTGRHTLMARASDSRDRVQPMRRDSDRRNYMISHVLPITVEAR
jgi:DMSO/TMAO reductase YedYZ molybdopterin-dependent catalytic subunit